MDDYLSFGFKIKKTLPNLFDQKLRLLSIPATSELIEHFFIISGSIKDKKFSNLSERMLVIIELCLRLI